MEAEAENNDLKKEENNNDNNNNNNESNRKIGNSSECLSKPKHQMKMPFQLETLEKAYANVVLSLAVERQEGVIGKEAAKGSGVAGFSGGGAQVGFYGICNSAV
ncbi:hypothetical protein JHK85_004069 [Glycine max]|nr:hypothetical protein JHK85_004069 [Glycine max]KAG5079831.1 hypothetical protein JHK86_003896 [Glycine max]